MTGDEPHRKMTVFIWILSVIAAAGFLIGAIVGLYFITRPEDRLLTISLLIVAFAGFLALMTDADGETIFLATAGSVPPKSPMAWLIWRLTVCKICCSACSIR
jgi:hypothetical protein